MRLFIAYLSFCITAAGQSLSGVSLSGAHMEGYPVPDAAWWYAGQRVWQDAALYTKATDTSAVTGWDDLSGNDRRLTQSIDTNQPSFSSAPYLAFDGVSDALSAASASDWSWMHSPTGGGWSILIALEPEQVTASSAPRDILNTGGFNSTDRGIAILQSVTDAVQVNISTGTSYVSSYGALAESILPGFNLIGVTWDPVGAGKLNMYSLGVQVATDKTNKVTPVSGAAKNALTLGRRGDAVTNGWAGRIYEAQIWRGVMDSNKLTTIGQMMSDRNGGNWIQWLDGQTNEQYSAFPRTTIDALGRLWAVWMRSTQHQAADSAIISSVSSDFGTTWSSPQVLLSTPGFEHRDPSIMTMTNGTLVVNWFNRSNDTSLVHGGYSMVSTDNGTNWTTPYQITNDLATTWGCAATPAAELHDGSLLLALYYGDGSSRVIRSYDNGLTWTNQTTIILDGALNHEPFLFAEGTNVLCTIRNNTTGTIDGAVSTDDGYTWTITPNIFPGHSVSPIIKTVAGKYLTINRLFTAVATIHWSTNFLTGWSTTAIPVSPSLGGSSGGSTAYLYGDLREVSPGVIGSIWSEEYGGATGSAFVGYRRVPEAAIIRNP